MSKNGATGRVASAVEGEGGFTLPEALVAIAFLAIGIAAVLSSAVVGISGVDGARRSTTALFLAEQRLEEVKAFAVSKELVQGWVNVDFTNATFNAKFPAEPYGAVSLPPGYRRTVTITNNPGGVATAKQVEIWVFYRPMTPAGAVTETAVTTATLLVSR